jgi:hypothetical protein
LNTIDPENSRKNQSTTRQKRYFSWNFHSRVLEEGLNRPTVDVKGICESIQARLIPEDWKIMIHTKERELKEAPRMFAMMVFEMRVYFRVTEMNIGKTIFEYFPQQTMTLDE